MDELDDLLRRTELWEECPIALMAWSCSQIASAAHPCAWKLLERAKAVALRFKKWSVARQFVYSLIILFGPLAPRVRAIPPDGVRQSALSVL